MCLFQRIARHDEGPVRQLRGPEDDRRERADPAQGADAQDSPALELTAQVHVRQTHNRQVGEVLHEGARFDGLHRRRIRTDRSADQRRALDEEYASSARRTDNGAHTNQLVICFVRARKLNKNDSGSFPTSFSSAERVFDLYGADLSNRRKAMRFLLFLQTLSH